MSKCPVVYIPRCVLFSEVEASGMNVNNAFVLGTWQVFLQYSTMHHVLWTLNCFTLLNHSHSQQPKEYPLAEYKSILRYTID